MGCTACIEPQCLYKGDLDLSLHCYKSNIARTNSLSYDDPNNSLCALCMKSVSDITNELQN